MPKPKEIKIPRRKRVPELNKNNSENSISGKILDVIKKPVKKLNINNLMEENRDHKKKSTNVS